MPGDVVRRHATQRGVVLGGGAELDRAEDVRRPGACGAAPRPSAGPVVPLVKSRIAMSSGSMLHSPGRCAPPRRAARGSPRARPRATPARPARPAARSASVTSTAGRDLRDQAVELGAGEAVVERHERHARPGGAEEPDRQRQAPHVEHGGVPRPALAEIARRPRRPPRTARRRSAGRRRSSRRRARRSPTPPSRAASSGSRSMDSARLRLAARPPARRTPV